MGTLFDLNLDGMADRIGGLTKEGVEELNKTLRAAVRVKAAEAILASSEEGSRLVKKEAMNLLTQIMKDNF